MSSDPYTHWTALRDDELTVEDVINIFGTVPDDLWVAAAAVDRVVDAVEVQRTLLECGIARTNAALSRSREAAASLNVASFTTALEEGDIPTEADNGLSSRLHTYFIANPHDAQLCDLRVLLLERLDRLNTFVEINEVALENFPDEPDEDEGDWEDDPWADETTPTSNKSAKFAPQFPFSLSAFLLHGLFQISCQLATLQWFKAIRTLQTRHTAIVWPLRFSILDSIPENVHPTNFRCILPAFDLSSHSESLCPSSPWRQEDDWTESSWVQTALQCVCVSVYGNKEEFTSSHNPFPHPLSPSELTAWYKRRVNKVVTSTGFVDVALATIQHGASQGIPDLDEVGEELSLLSRLVYDAPQGAHIEDDWTLDRWSNMEPSAIVHAYLAYSTPESISKDISRLVLPYLVVLESRAERAGSPDPDLLNRLLYEYILTAPLQMAAAIFEASKPTLSMSQRLIKNEGDVVRLALACLYGNDSLDQWSTMSRIFECLPAWDISREEDSDEDITDTTITSLGAFLKPSTDRPQCTPHDLFIFFKPLPVTSLSRALDILDVHLESGEILSRWSVPAPLRWFLQSNGNIEEQQAWAKKMARRAGGSNDELTSLEDWEWLLEDMLQLTGKGDTGVPGAFGLLARDDLLRFFLSGLLSTGKFNIAKDMLRLSQKFSMDASKVEDICLECSREFYDNAQSGNYKIGDLKLAYECLDVPQPSQRLIREKEFIEATSRLSSFNLFSRPGIPISPIEIRLTTDRLSLISRVLSSNNDAYKHSEVILDLVRKLGYRNDVVAEVKTLAMLGDTALQAEDFDRAFEFTERMVAKVAELQKTPNDPCLFEAAEVCWVSCFQLGRQQEFDEMDKKLYLLGQALELCPSEKLHDILAAWSRLGKEDIDLRKQRLSSTNDKGIAVSASHERTFTAGNVASSLRARLQEFHMPSPPLLSTPDAAALASRTFRSVTANFPFSVARSSQASDKDGSRASSLFRGDGEDVSAQAARVFNKGVGWLIGADDD
ncbi:hypothetical protein H0H93_015230 [Arthromyces matolae]|nr:hypothetical protein H0H93_015230 [Arthromyces matolae]